YSPGHGARPVSLPARRRVARRYDLGVEREREGDDGRGEAPRRLEAGAARQPLRLTSGLLCRSPGASTAGPLTPPLPTRSASTTTFTPCAHWPRHPDLQTRSRSATPSDFERLFSRSRISSAPRSEQHASPFSRWFVQTKTCVR